MSNRLANETSPYLKQHQDNPVDWYPWNDTALSQAKQDNKPIFLSIGYAACHWCHVMAHESFENVQTAQILNKNFINIKVDREERPDIDDIYMQAVVMLTGQGGWPLSVFLTPDLKPFFGGTYFPPIPRHRLPSFNQVLLSVIDTWKNNPDAIQNNAEILTKEIRRKQSQQNHLDQAPNLDSIVDRLYNAFDWQTGGWGNAPKFPQPMLIEFLIQRGLLGNQQAKEMTTNLLNSMARGGMYDLIGGGFHRYSTDQAWLIPHFEKMLYDNAQLALAYLHGYVLTGLSTYENVVNQTLTFILEEMTDTNGAFFASIDADTPEGEGRYYAWTITELDKVLSEEELKKLQAMVDISAKGNFEEDLNILHLKTQIIGEGESNTNAKVKQLEEILYKLKTIRKERTPPAKDKKIITEWNAMAIRALAEAGVFLDRPEYVLAAKQCTDFLLNNLLTPSGTLYRTWCEGKPSQPGTLADYAGLIAALHALYVIDFEAKYFNHMLSLFKTMQKLFSSENGLYFDSAADVPSLIVRPRNLQDNATPSGNAISAYTHWLFSNYNHDPAQLDYAQKMIFQVGENIKTYPTSFGFWLQVAGLINENTQQIALVSDKGLESLEPFLKVYRNKYRPFSIIAVNHADIGTDSRTPPILNDRPAINGMPTAYVCQEFMCQTPVTTPGDFKSKLA